VAKATKYTRKALIYHDPGLFLCTDPKPTVIGRCKKDARHKVIEENAEKCGGKHQFQKA
jgi:hypothetical protein